MCDFSGPNSSSMFSCKAKLYMNKSDTIIVGTRIMQTKGGNETLCISTFSFNKYSLKICFKDLHSRLQIVSTNLFKWHLQYCVTSCLTG